MYNIYFNFGAKSCFFLLATIRSKWVSEDPEKKIAFLRDRHADKKSGQIEFLVPKDVQCSQTYAKTIFQLKKKSFN